MTKEKLPSDVTRGKEADFLNKIPQSNNSPIRQSFAIRYLQSRTGFSGFEIPFTYRDIALASTYRFQIMILRQRWVPVSSCDPGLYPGLFKVGPLWGLYSKRAVTRLTQFRESNRDRVAFDIGGFLSRKQGVKKFGYPRSWSVTHRPLFANSGLYETKNSQTPNSKNNPEPRIPNSYQPFNSTVKQLPSSTTTPNLKQTSIHQLDSSPIRQPTLTMRIE